LYYAYEMFFSRLAPVNTKAAPDKHLQVRLLPSCYDEFKGTKIYNIIEHPKPEGDRIFLSIPYAGSAVVKALGARWSPDLRRWWYWSGSTAQLAHYFDTEAWLEVLNHVHLRSVFAEWPMDVDTMRTLKNESLSLYDFFDYCNPNPSADATDDCGNPAFDAHKK